MNQAQGMDWVARLSGTPDEQEIALSELRELLVRRLRHAFRSNAKVDDSFVDDMVQEGLLAILGSMDQFQGRSQFATWATTIAIRMAIGELRRRKWKDISLEQLLEDPPSDLQSNRESKVSFENKILQTEMFEAMQRVIRDQLTQKQRVALQAELRGMPQEEIGRRLGSNRNAIYKLVHDARKRLKKGMMDAGYSAEDMAYLRSSSR